MSAFKGLTPFDPRFWKQLEHMAAVCAKQEASLRGSRLVETPSKEVVVMRLTNNIGGGEYEFAEQEPIAGGGWRLKAGGATYAGGGHARTGRCFEANLNARVRVPSYQIGTVKYDSAGTPFYRFENCCQTIPASGSGGSDDPTTTDDGIATITLVHDWFCMEAGPECSVPVIVKHTYRHTLDAVPQLQRVRIVVATDCAFVTCTPDPAGSGGGGSGEMHIVLRPCNQDMVPAYPQPGDILIRSGFAPSVPEWPNPVFQIDGVGPCYTPQGLATGTPTMPSLDIHQSCDDEACDNCDCEDTCIRISANKDGNTDWAEITLIDGQTWCPEQGASDATKGGDTGGLAGVGGLGVPEFFWVANRWEVLVGDAANTWVGVFRGNADGCPSGTFTLVETVSGTPPLTVTVSECDPVCAAEPPARLRIAGYTPDMFGAIKTFFLGSCVGPSYSPAEPYNEWDGTFPFRQGEECIWWPIEDHSGTVYGGLFYRSDDPTPGRAWLLNKNTNFTRAGLIGGVWQVPINVEGSTTSGSIVYKKTSGQEQGVYTLDLAACSASVQEAACYVPIPETITIEEY